MRHFHQSWPHGLAIALAAAALVAGGTAAAAAALPPAAAAGVPVRRDFVDLGRAPGGMPMGISVVLRYRRDDELTQLVAAQSDRRSPLYRHYLTNEQFNGFFAPSTADYARTAEALRRAGFRIDRFYTNRMIVSAVAPAAIIERYFGTEIHLVNQRGYGLRYANSKPAVMPLGMRGIAASVTGLDNLINVRYPHPTYASKGASSLKPSMMQMIQKPGPVSTATPRPNPSPEPTLSPKVRGAGGGYTSFTIATAYDFPVQHGYDGLGRSAGNVISGDYADSDLTGFLTDVGETRYGPATVRILVSGTTNHDPNSADVQESTLDVEAIVGLAPGVSFYEYLMPSLTDKSIEDAYNRVVSDNLVEAVNSSFGGCETDDPSFEYVTNYIAKQGAAKGITFSAATGDTGSNGCGGVTNGAPGTAPGVGIPAADYYFTAVGGTDLFVNEVSGAYVNETGWESGGGGVSKLETLPSWQAKTSGVTTTGRNVPDIALDAALETGYEYYENGVATTIGGTSLSSPLFVGLQSEINQIQHRRHGWVNPRLYQIVNAVGYFHFRDVVGGSNGGFTAVPGYDNVTGIGSPIGWLLAGTE
jgi:subtilase family serine protease